MLHRSRFCRALLVAFLSSCVCAAHAGSISFSLALTGTRLTLGNAGDSVAFFPGALVMRADGNWQPLSSPAGQKAPTQLAPGESMELIWPDTRPLELLSAVERLRPAMVRFHDQAGVSFGQISFFTTPPPATAIVAANYAAGEFHLSPPGGKEIRATWVLWPHEAGIAGIREAFSGHDIQPPARRIDWLNQPKPLSVSTGAGLPAVTLLHETAQGYQVQRVASGWQGGKQQRAAWLDSSRLFYSLALGFAALAAGVALWSAWQARSRPAGT